MLQLIQNHWFITLLIVGILFYYIRKAIVVPSIVEKWYKDPDVSFKDNIAAMTGAELVQSMINGLRHRWVHFDANTFGKADYPSCGSDDVILYGCPACNLECEVHTGAFDANSIGDRKTRATFLGITTKGCSGVRPDENWLENFEMAINDLRQGDITGYNSYAENIPDHLPTLKIPPFALPRLEGKKVTYWQLRTWQKYANWLDEK